MTIKSDTISTTARIQSDETTAQKNIMGTNSITLKSPAIHLDSSTGMTQINGKR